MGEAADVILGLGTLYNIVKIKELDEKLSKLEKAAVKHGDPISIENLGDAVKSFLLDLLLGLVSRFGVTIFVENNLDQPVTVQLLGNRVPGIAGAVGVGSPFTVAAGSTDARTLTPDTSGWLPFITARVQCVIAPSGGTVTIWLIKSKDVQVKIVDSLAITDTNPHDASTDPNNIFVVEW